MCGTKLGLITERVLDPYAYYRTLVDVTKELWSPSSVECVGYCYVLEENAFCFAGALVHNPSDNFECKYTSDPFKFMGATEEPQVCPDGEIWTGPPDYGCALCPIGTITITSPFSIFDQPSGNAGIIEKNKVNKTK